MVGTLAWVVAGTVIGVLFIVSVVGQSVMQTGMVEKDDESNGTRDDEAL